MSHPIFMDYLSTTPVDPRIATAMIECITDVFGNPSSTDHSFGTNAAQIVETARDQVAELIEAPRARIILTSGATEAINIIIRHVVRRISPLRKARIMLSSVEHSAVLETSKQLAAAGQAELTFLSVDKQGRLQIDSLEEEINRGADLVCVMAANNEIGNIYPVEHVARICKAAAVPFLCDASQAAGRVPIKFDNWDITYMAVSAHKMYGPKGAGAIVANRNFVPQAAFTGGNQEFSVRPGTLNVPAIFGFGQAAKLRLLEMQKDEPEIKSKRDRLQGLLKKAIPDLCVNGDTSERLAGALHVSIPGIPNDAVIARIRHVLAISRGAACSSGIETPSHVLSAMGLAEPLIESALRISIGKFTSDDEIVRAVDLLSAAVADVQAALGRISYERVC